MRLYCFIILKIEKTFFAFHSVQENLCDFDYSIFKLRLRIFPALTLEFNGVVRKIEFFFPFRKKKRRIKKINRKKKTEREREIINNDNNVVILSRGLSGV